MDHSRKSVLVIGLVMLMAFAMAGCEGDQGPQGPPGESPGAGDLTCTECHSSSNQIAGKVLQWEESAHGMGDSYVRGTRSSCAGCHSGNAFVAMVEAGGNPGDVAEGDPNPTRQDCYACHQIHQTYTAADYALTTTAPVDFYAVDGATYDGGTGNLCVTCHQPRRTIPDPVDGTISGISTHWGPHHGGQGSMMLGVAGAGDVTGSPSVHYNLIDDTCSNCHLGDEGNHTFEADLASCTPCHGELDDFDYNNVQTDVQAMIDELGDRLVAAGLIDENTPDGHPTVSEAPTDQAIALWNWIYVAHEDGSLGVHNPSYTMDLLQEGLDRLPAPPAK